MLLRRNVFAPFGGAGELRFTQRSPPRGGHLVSHRLPPAPSSTNARFDGWRFAVIPATFIRCRVPLLLRGLARHKRRLRAATETQLRTVRREFDFSAAQILNLFGWVRRVAFGDDFPRAVIVTRNELGFVWFVIGHGFAFLAGWRTLTECRIELWSAVCSWRRWSPVAPQHSHGDARQRQTNAR